MAWYLVLLSLALTIALLDSAAVGRRPDWPRSAWPTFVAAALVAVVGSFSSLQGLLIWPVGLVLMYQRRWPLWAFVSWIGAAGVTVVLHFHNFVTIRVDNLGLVLSHAYLGVRVFWFALGDVVGVQERLQDPPNAAVMAFGIAIFILALFVLLRSGIRRDEHNGAPIGVSLIVFGRLFDALMTQGRFWLKRSLSGTHHQRADEVRPAEIAALNRQRQRFFAWFWGTIERVDRPAVARIALPRWWYRWFAAFHSALGTPAISIRRYSRLHL